MESMPSRLRFMRAVRILMWAAAAGVVAAWFGLVDVSAAVLLVLAGVAVVSWLIGYRGPSQRDWSAFHDTYGRVGGNDGGGV